MRKRLLGLFWWRRVSSGIGAIKTYITFNKRYVDMDLKRSNRGVPKTWSMMQCNNAVFLSMKPHATVKLSFAY